MVTKNRRQPHAVKSTTEQPTNPHSIYGVRLVAESLHQGQAREAP